VEARVAVSARRNNGLNRRGRPADSRHGREGGAVGKAGGVWKGRPKEEKSRKEITQPDSAAAGRWGKGESFQLPTYGSRQVRAMPVCGGGGDRQRHTVQQVGWRSRPVSVRNAGRPFAQVVRFEMGEMLQVGVNVVAAGGGNEIWGGWPGPVRPA
jgi:hypothetical protein